MKMAIGSDSTNGLTEHITAYLEEKGIELVRFGSLAGEKADYVDAAQAVAEAVASGQSTLSRRKRKVKTGLKKSGKRKRAATAGSFHILTRMQTAR